MNDLTDTERHTIEIEEKYPISAISAKKFAEEAWADSPARKSSAETVIKKFAKLALDRKKWINPLSIDEVPDKYALWHLFDSGLVRTVPKDELGKKNPVPTEKLVEFMFERLTDIKTVAPSTP
jgi:hypothetical protein